MSDILFPMGDAVHHYVAPRAGRIAPPTKSMHREKQHHNVMTCAHADENSETYGEAEPIGATISADFHALGAAVEGSLHIGADFAMARKEDYTGNGYLAAVQVPVVFKRESIADAEFLHGHAHAHMFAEQIRHAFQEIGVHQAVPSRILPMEIELEQLSTYHATHAMQLKCTNPEVQYVNSKVNHGEHFMYTFLGNKTPSNQFHHEVKLFDASKKFRKAVKARFFNSPVPAHDLVGKHGLFAKTEMIAIEMGAAGGTTPFVLVKAPEHHHIHFDRAEISEDEHRDGMHIWETLGTLAVRVSTTGMEDGDFLLNPLSFARALEESDQIRHVGSFGFDIRGDDTMKFTMKVVPGISLDHHSEVKVRTGNVLAMTMNMTFFVPGLVHHEELHEDDKDCKDVSNDMYGWSASESESESESD